MKRRPEHRLALFVLCMVGSGESCFQRRPIRYFTNPYAFTLSHCRVMSQRPFISISLFSPLMGIQSRSSQQSVFGSANATDSATGAGWACTAYKQESNIWCSEWHYFDHASSNKTQEKISFRLINSGTCNKSLSLPIIQESYFGQPDSDGEDESSALALESTPGSLCVV